MATTDIETSEYWESPGIDIRLNPASMKPTDGLERAIRDRGIDSAVVLATSGSEGQPKFVVLEKSAILHSAAAVNTYCSIDEYDSWMAGLSTFHIGGLAIYARAVLSNSTVQSMKWDDWTRNGRAFLNATKEATLTSLTPIHLYDLVTYKIECPPKIRGVFIGGGRLSSIVAGQAFALGYPIWGTFGMTETASQIATSVTDEFRRLPILPCWQTQISKSGKLRVKGPALMKGYFTKSNDGWQWHNPTDESGYFETGDLVDIKGNLLIPQGRADQQLKILGELVSLPEIEAVLSKATGCNSVAWAKPHERRGFELFACIESDQVPAQAEQAASKLGPYKALRKIYSWDNFPRSEVGKIDRQAVIDKFS